MKPTFKKFLESYSMSIMDAMDHITNEGMIATILDIMGYEFNDVEPGCAWSQKNVVVALVGDHIEILVNVRGRDDISLVAKMLEKIVSSKFKQYTHRADVSVDTKLAVTSAAFVKIFIEDTNEDEDDEYI